MIVLCSHTVFDNREKQHTQLAPVKSATTLNYSRERIRDLRYSIRMEEVYVY
jgi:hypothetical protein